MAGSGEWGGWERVLEDLATGKIFPHLSLDHRQEMALILLLHWRTRGVAPDDRVRFRAFRAARARLHRTTSPSGRWLPIDVHDLQTSSSPSGTDIRQQALDALQQIVAWPAANRRFFLAVALDAASPIASARRHLGSSWTARQARRHWESLRVRLAKTLA